MHLRLPAALLVASAICAGQTTTKPLVNLGRLAITRVYGDGDQTDFYGVQNAFDGGQHVINGINYSTWTGESIAIVRFTMPVTVHGLVVVIGNEYGPGEFSVQVRSVGARAPLLSPSIPVSHLTTLYALPKPEPLVREVLISFRGGHGRVEEIEILGYPPRGVSLAPVTPSKDTELVARLKPEYFGNDPANIALVRKLAESAERDMRAIRLRLTRASNPHAKAQAWYDLNEAADRLAELLQDKEELKAIAEQAGKLGVELPFCDPSASWGAATNGYEEYLRLWPDGPNAELAWRRSKLSEGPRCGDGEGTVEEDDYWIKQYSEFLGHFPDSSIAGTIRQRLAETKEHRQQQLDAEKETAPVQLK